MTVALIAAVAGTLGVVIGRFWDVRSEARRWQRDQKTASYQRMAEEFRSAAERIRAVALADPASPDFSELVNTARAASGWDDAYSAVWLHGSPAVVEAAVSLDLAMTELHYDALERHHSPEDWYRIRTPARATFQNFLEAVRKELHLQPVPAAFFPALARQVPAPPPEPPIP